MRMIAFGLALLFLPAAAYAAWTTNGIPICTAPNLQSQQTLASDGAGGFYVAWTDARSGTGTDVYLTRVLGDGNIAANWPANGMRISWSGTGLNPVVVPDGAGGALVIWQRQGYLQVRFQRVDENAELWLPADGYELLDSFTGRAPYAVASDGAGGAYVAVTRPALDGTTESVYLTRVDNFGGFLPPFNATGIVLETRQFISSVLLSADPSDGVVWEVDSEYDGPFHHGYVNGGRVTGSGTTVSAYLGEGWGGSAIADGQGGLFAHWSGSGPPYLPPINGKVLQRVDAAGGKAWPGTGVPSGGAIAALVRDGAGGVFEIATDYAAPRNLEVRRRLPDGTVPSGWPITLAPDLATPPQPGGVSTTAGFIALWAQKGTDFDLHAAGYMTNGALAPGWPAGGVPVTALAGDQMNAALLATPTEGVFAVWQDARPGSAGGDLYAMRVEPDRVVGVAPGVQAGAVAFRAIVPNPAHDFVRVDLALANGAPTTLELVDLRGRVLARRDAGASTTLATRTLPAGLYWLRATQDGHVAHARVAVVH